jgi:hypothetical protein
MAIAERNAKFPLPSNFIGHVQVLTLIFDPPDWFHPRPVQWHPLLFSPALIAGHPAEESVFCGSEQYHLVEACISGPSARQARQDKKTSSVGFPARLDGQRLSLPKFPHGLR